MFLVFSSILKFLFNVSNLSSLSITYSHTSYILHSLSFIDTGSTITNHTIHFIRLTFKNIQIAYKKIKNKSFCFRKSCYTCKLFSWVHFQFRFVGGSLWMHMSKKDYRLLRILSCFSNKNLGFLRNGRIG